MAPVEDAAAVLTGTAAAAFNGKAVVSAPVRGVAALVETKAASVEKFATEHTHGVAAAHAESKVVPVASGWFAALTPGGILENCARKHAHV